MTENELTTPIGTEEVAKLKPARVTILSVESGEFGNKKSKKLVCMVKHPEKAEPLKISAAKVEINGELKVSGLWINKDSQLKLKKNSVLAAFLSFLKCSNAMELINKECETIQDEKGYLMFKGY